MKRLLIAALIALLAVPVQALAAWDLSRISGPWSSAHVAGLIFVLPAAQVTAAEQAYAEPVPPDVPVLAGVPSKALVFPDEATAKRVLAGYWT